MKKKTRESVEEVTLTLQDGGIITVHLLTEKKKRKK